MRFDRGTLLFSLSLLLCTSGSDAFAQAKKKPKADLAASGASAAESPVLSRALKLYEGGGTDDLYSASIELFKVVEGESGDSEANKQKAEFFMGKTMHKLKFYSAALTYFDKIVAKGAAHAHYNETLKWLASLADDVAESAGVLDKIGKYQRADLDQPALESVRDQLYFLLGKYNYTKG